MPVHCLVPLSGNSPPTCHFPGGHGLTPHHLQIGQAASVLVHTPGAELRAVTPGNKGDYLYDDIIQVEPAQREHRRFVAVLQRFATVYQVADLLAEALERPEARSTSPAAPSTRCPRSSWAGS